MPGIGSKVLLAFTIALIAAGSAQAQLRYRVEMIGVLGPDSASSLSWAYSLNNHGTAVGYSNTLDDDVTFRAFVYDKGQIRGLGDLNGVTTSQARGINDRGQIVGMGLVDGVQRAYIATPVTEAGTWALMLRDWAAWAPWHGAAVQDGRTDARPPSVAPCQ